MSPACTKQAQVQGQTKLFRALSNSILGKSKDADSISNQGNIILSSLSSPKLEPYLAELKLSLLAGLFSWAF